MTPLTAAQVAKARKSWGAILDIESPTAQVHAVAFWTSLWAPKLLAAAEVLTSLQDAVKVPRIFKSEVFIAPVPTPARDPDP